MLRLALLIAALFLTCTWGAEPVPAASAGDWAGNPAGAAAAAQQQAVATIGTAAATTATWLTGILAVLVPILIAVGKAIGPELAAANPAAGAVVAVGGSLANLAWSALAPKSHLADDAAVVTQSSAFQSIVALLNAAQADPAGQKFIADTLAKLPSVERDAVLAALQALGHPAAVPKAA